MAALAPNCGAALRESRGVEVGNIFQLGTKFTEALGGDFLDAEGKSQPVVMGSYGIGVGRLLACVAEEYHDEDGLVWPIAVAPYQVHIVLLAKGAGAAQDAGEQLYADLTGRGIEVLLDDRRENPGVKFNDADLIGIPVRVTVGDRGLQKENCRGQAAARKRAARHAGGAGGRVHSRTRWRSYNAS